MTTTRYWIITASSDHVSIGREGGFCQACHGKRGPLERMRAGDGVAFYSPRTEMRGGDKVQAFTAIGTVAAGDVCQVTMAPGFRPFRRAVTFWPARAAPVVPLLHRLSFVKDPARWGFPFRRGHFEVSAADFELIAAAMGQVAGTMGTTWAGRAG